MSGCFVAGLTGLEPATSGVTERVVEDLESTIHDALTVCFINLVFAIFEKPLVREFPRFYRGWWAYHVCDRMRPYKDE